MNEGRSGESFSTEYARWGLAIIVVVAVLIRLQSLAFGLPAVNDQDELLFQLGAMRMLQGPTLNPHWFGHPATTTMYVLALNDIAVFLTGLAAGWWGSVRGFVQILYVDPSWVMLPGRAVMVAFGALSIILTARLGERIGGWKVGLAAAAVLAVTPLHIEFSQIIRSDMMASSFMLLSMLAATRAAQGHGDLRYFLLAGAWAGIAVATKWPSALVLVCLFGAALLRWRDGERDLRLLVLRCFSGGAASVATLIIASPFLLLDWQTVVANLAGEARVIHLGATGGSFLYNIWWYLSEPLLRTMSPIGSALAVAGIVVLACNWSGRFILLPFLAVQLVVLASQNLVWERWVLPMLPILALAVAHAAVALFEWAGRHWPKWIAAMVGAVIGITTGTMMAVHAYAEAEQRLNDTRQLATQLVLQQAKSGDTVLIEHFGFDLMVSGLRILWPVATAGCLDARTLLGGQISLQETEGLRRGSSNVDIGSVPLDMAGTCRADYVVLSHYDRYLAEKQRFPEQFARYQALLKDYEQIAIFTPPIKRQSTRTVRVLRLKAERGQPSKDSALAVRYGFDVGPCTACGQGGSYVIGASTVMGLSFGHFEANVSNERINHALNLGRQVDPRAAHATGSAIFSEHWPHVDAPGSINCQSPEYRLHKPLMQNVVCPPDGSPFAIG